MKLSAIQWKEKTRLVFLIFQAFQTLNQGSTISSTYEIRLLQLYTFVIILMDFKIKTKKVLFQKRKINLSGHVQAQLSLQFDSSFYIILNLYSVF